MASAIVMSVYSFVDAIAVGQSEGAAGTAAMAVIAPVYGVTVFLALLCGIGGSVMMSMARGEGKEEKGNACFTVSSSYLCRFFGKCRGMVGYAGSRTHYSFIRIVIRCEKS